MNSINTPYRIELLLHCHTSRAKFRHTGTAVYEDAIRDFIERGVIIPSGMEDGFAIYATTPLGKAWVEAICNVPIPTVRFVDEQGRVLQSK